MHKAWQKENSEEGSLTPDLFDNDDKVVIHTLEGVMKVDWNDWIIQGVNGEIYPCKPDIFEKTYEEVK